MNILIFALVEVFVVIGLIVFGMQRKLKKAEREIERLTRVATKYKDKCTEMEIMAITTPDKDDKVELEADEDTYNQTIKEWIYGAEKKEGGIDG